MSTHASEDKNSRTIASLSIAFFLLPYLSYTSIMTNPLSESNDQSFSEIRPTHPSAGTMAYHTYFDVTGVVPGPVDIDLKAGWNLVGYPSLTDRTVADALIGVSYARAEGFDDLSPYHLRALSDTDYMTTGLGYWMYVTQDTVWTVNP